ncbi:MAG: anhydro-N-acetylmuramic acid kinase, partial [Bacteroidetes bacterium]|nr:anhydro-N-acetylmuramic acid kinase [Bacteroidota bacterium]
MSGTSMDAVDIAAVRLTGSGESMGVEIIGWVEVPFDLELRACLSETISCGSATLKDLTLLQTRLSIAFEEAIREALPTMGLPLSDIEVIGRHGTTL